MKTNTFVKLALALGLALSAQTTLRAQHGHLNAGARGTQQNDQLTWANGADFVASSTYVPSYVKTLEYTNAGKYAGYFQGGITPTALPATAANAGPDPAAPALGSVIKFNLTCLSGPPGGAFGFWDTGATNPSLSLMAGETSTNLWVLSQNDGSPGSDPYGHIHGRRFTATKPGIYKVGFQARDVSTNGTASGPIHAPSAVLPVYFQAGITIAEVEPDEEEGHVHVRFGAWAGFTWQVEATTYLGPQADWISAGNPVIGNDLFIEIIHDRPPGAQRFYRVRGTLISPP